VVSKPRVLDHVVFVVGIAVERQGGLTNANQKETEILNSDAVDVRVNISALGRDGAEFDGQRIPSRRYDSTARGEDHSFDSERTKRNGLKLITFCPCRDSASTQHRNRRYKRVNVNADAP
jgi:hypothetical protein